MRNLLLMIGATLVLASGVSAQSGGYTVGSPETGDPLSKTITPTSPASSVIIEQDAGSIDAITVVIYDTDGSSSAAHTVLAGTVFIMGSSPKKIESVVITIARTADLHWANGTWQFNS